MRANGIFSSCLMNLCLVSLAKGAKGIDFSKMGHIVRKTEATLCSGGVKGVTLWLEASTTIRKSGYCRWGKLTEVLSLKRLSDYSRACWGGSEILKKISAAPPNSFSRRQCKSFLKFSVNLPSVNLTSSYVLGCNCLRRKMTSSLLPSIAHICASPRFYL